MDWHGKAPNDEQYRQAMEELRNSYDILQKEAERNG